MAIAAATCSLVLNPTHFYTLVSVIVSQLGMLITQMFERWYCQMFIAHAEQVLDKECLILSIPTHLATTLFSLTNSKWQ